MIKSRTAEQKETGLTSAPYKTRINRRNCLFYPSIEYIEYSVTVIFSTFLQVLGGENKFFSIDGSRCLEFYVIFDIPDVELKK